MDGDKRVPKNRLSTDDYYVVYLVYLFFTKNSTSWIRIAQIAYLHYRNIDVSENEHWLSNSVKALRKRVQDRLSESRKLLLCEEDHYALCSENTHSHIKFEYLDIPFRERCAIQKTILRFTHNARCRVKKIKKE